MKVFTSPFADWPWISRLCGQPMACLWTHMSSGCLCMLFLWSGTLRGSTVFLVIWSLDVSYCRKYVTKHHFGLRWIFHFCFIVHSLGLQLAGTGLPGLKDTLFFLLGDLLIMDERFYHVFFWQSVLSWPMQIQWLWLSWRFVMPEIQNISWLCSSLLIITLFMWCNFSQLSPAQFPCVVLLDPECMTSSCTSSRHPCHQVCDFLAQDQLSDTWCDEAFACPQSLWS